jgi:hypothetical protein
METPITQAKSQYKKKESAQITLPDVKDVISEWFSQEYPDRLRHDCWWKDHSQYREYHKSL